LFVTGFYFSPAAAALARHNASLAAALANLAKPDAHLVHSVGDGAVVCAGKTGVAALYAAYSLGEELGAGFYLHGEVLPPPRPSLGLPKRLYRTFTPRFATRGIQPFHDFPMGYVAIPVLTLHAARRLANVDAPETAPVF